MSVWHWACFYAWRHLHADARRAMLSVVATTEEREVFAQVLRGAIDRRIGLLKEAVSLVNNLDLAGVGDTFLQCGCPSRVFIAG